MIYKKRNTNLTWWHIPIIPVLRRLRQEVQEFEASLGPCL
jgi:hypothetical protein